VSERTNSWDAIGVGAYGLTIALIESVFVFLVVMALGFLVSKKWDLKKRISILGFLFTILALWGIVGQLYYFVEVSVPVEWIQFLASKSHPLRVLYAICLIAIAPTIFLPGYGILKSRKIANGFYEFFDRISLLVALYLILDIAGIIIVVIRNL
jgi:hypothetical protein